MKRKFLAKAITLGVMLAVPFGVEAAAQGTIDNSVASVTLADGTVINDTKANPNVEIENWNGGDYSRYAAIVAWGKAGTSLEPSALKVDIANNGTIVLKHTTDQYHNPSGKVLENVGVYTWGDSANTITINGNLDIQNFNFGVRSVNGGDIVINGNVSVTDSSYGILSQSDSLIKIDGHYKFSGNNGISGKAIEILNGVDINAEKKGIDAVGEIKIAGDTLVRVADGQEALHSQNKGNLKINEDGTATVNVYGDSYTAYSGRLDIRLTNEKSSITGKFKTLEKNGSEVNSPGDLSNGSMLTLKNNAVWNNTGNSRLNTIVLDNGVINQTTEDAAIILGAYDGRDGGTTNGVGGKLVGGISGNGIINLFTTTTDDGNLATAKDTIRTVDASNIGNLYYRNASKNNQIDISNANLTLGTYNASADNVTDGNEQTTLNNLLEAVQKEDANGKSLRNQVKSVGVKDGYFKKGFSADVENGVLKKDETSGEVVIDKATGDTDTVAAIKKLPSINLVSWRTENNELSKRLGEVRDYDGEEGIWARMNHGESKYLDSFETKGHLYQMGYDKKVGEWRLGGAVSYNKGTTIYENGNGKNRSTSLALYGAWLGDKGHYADIIVKEGKQKSELTIGQAGLAASNLDYDLWATSISAEYGRKIALKSDWFVEPQAELTYGRLGSADYGDNGFTVHQDSMDSLVGRMGFRLGKNLSDTSNIYMKASVLHEFCGDVDYSFTEGTNSKVSSVDLGDTWYEVGVGGSAQIGKATYAYAGIEKTFGGDFSTPWQWNAGVRWSF